MRLATALIAAASFSAFADNMCAPALPPVNALSPDQLEHAFWECDYVAATRGTVAAPVVYCTAVTAELERKKFAGDFDRLVKWWRLNKLSEYQKLEQVETPPSG